MTMKLAEDEITIRIGRDTVVLRPTLRAALRLERRHGGFDHLLRAVADGNLGVMADLIRESATDRSDIPGILENVGEFALRGSMEPLTAPLLNHVFKLAGVDSDNTQDEAEPKTSTPRVSFAEHFAKLFAIATGWLGWTPEQAWSATPAEIIAAYHGRLDMLGAIFGTEMTDDGEPDGEAVKAGIAKLKAIAAIGGNIGVH